MIQKTKDRKCIPNWWDWTNLERGRAQWKATLASSPPYLDMTTEVSRLPEAANRHASKNLQSSALNSSRPFNPSSSWSISFSVNSCHAYATDLASIASMRSSFIITCTILIIDDALPASKCRFSFSYDAMSLAMEIWSPRRRRKRWSFGSFWFAVDRMENFEQAHVKLEFDRISTVGVGEWD